MERRIQEEQLRQMQLQTERMQAETERLRKLKQKAPAATSNAQLTEAAQEVDSALTDVAQMYPDFAQYFPQVERLMHLFVRGSGSSGSLTTKEYVEGLYVIAKFASFSQAKNVQKAPTEAPKGEGRP